MSIAEDLLDMTRSVTRKWTKQRKAEERNSRARAARQYIYSDRVNFSDVADRVIPKGYLHASGEGHYSVAQRQMYYACREAFREATGRDIEADYFCQNLLVKYLNRHPVITAAWKITADPRGTLVIPNATHPVRIPVGTLSIDTHLRTHENNRNLDRVKDIPNGINIEWPSMAGGQRYKAVLYIEKEGFEPLLQEARISKRFEVAILSCKGQSVVAARKFVDHVCRVNGGVPLFVVHDFDKYGFEISECLTRVSDAAALTDRVKYEFQNKINVTDLGLRLADVEKYDLQSEFVVFKGNFSADSICTEEEQEFLRSNRRVELNAFTSPQFIEWLESKLVAHGLGKRLVPNDGVLAHAYRRAVVVARINTAMKAARADAIKRAADLEAPKSLRRAIQQAMKDDPELTWDRALYAIEESKLSDADGGS